MPYQMKLLANYKINLMLCDLRAFLLFYLSPNKKTIVLETNFLKRKQSVSI